MRKDVNVCYICRTIIVNMITDDDVDKIVSGVVAALRPKKTGPRPWPKARVEFIEEYRGHPELSRAQAAKEYGVSRQTITNWIREYEQAHKK